jgi:hypothetical protein
MDDEYLGPMNIDNLGRMLMALLSEHWILRDRFAVLEALMIARGALAPGELDDHVPSEAEAARIEALRERTVGAVIGAPPQLHVRPFAAICGRARAGRPASRAAP